MNANSFLAHYGKKGMHWGIITSKYDEKVRNPKSSIADDIGAAVGIQGSIDKKATQEAHKNAANEGIAYGERQAKSVGELLSGKNKNVLAPEGSAGFRNSQVDTAVQMACKLLTKETVDSFNSGNYTTEDIKNLYQGATVFSSFLDQASEYGGEQVSSALENIETMSSQLSDMYTKIEKNGGNPLEDPEYMREERKVAEKIDAEVDKIQTGLGMSRPDPKRSEKWTSEEQYQELSWSSTHRDLVETMYLTGISSARPITQDENPDPNKRMTYHADAKAKHDGMTDDFLAHHGVVGQKWRRRRYQNPDGSLTELGRIHYGVGQREERTDGGNSSKQKSSGEKESEKKFRSKTKTYKAEDMRNLTTEELKKRTERLRAENDYRNAVNANRVETASHRKQVVKKIFLDSMANAASEIMKTVYTSTAKRFLNNTAPWLLDYKYTDDKTDSGKDDSTKKDKKEKKKES